MEYYHIKHIIVRYTDFISGTIMFVNYLFLNIFCLKNRLKHVKFLRKFHEFEIHFQTIYLTRKQFSCTTIIIFIIFIIIYYCSTIIWLHYHQALTLLYFYWIVMFQLILFMGGYLRYIGLVIQQRIYETNEIFRKTLFVVDCMKISKYQLNVCADVFNNISNLKRKFCTTFGSKLQFIILHCFACVTTIIFSIMIQWRIQTNESFLMYCSFCVYSTILPAVALMIYLGRIFHLIEIEVGTNLKFL